MQLFRTPHFLAAFAGAVVLSGISRADVLRVGLVGCPDAAALALSMQFSRDEIEATTWNENGNFGAVLVMPQQLPGISELSRLRQYLASGGGLVVVGLPTVSKPNHIEALDRLIGARQDRVVTEERPLRAISLYHHPIVTDDVSNFETSGALPNYVLSTDAEVVIEGLSGEDPIPLMWVEKIGAGRLVVVVPGDNRLWQVPLNQRLLSNALRWSSHREISGSRAVVQRVLMPNAYPSAIAITFPRGPGVCYDPARRGIDYIWDGDFVDRRATWTAKHGSAQKELASKIFGPTFYTESLAPTLHTGTPKLENYKFLGYRVDAGVPELKYTIGDRLVHESLHPLSGGTGIERRFRVGSGHDVMVLELQSQKDSEIEVHGALPKENAGDKGHTVSFDSPSGGEFSVTIRSKRHPAP